MLVYHWISEFVKLKFVVTFYENVHMDIKKTELLISIVKKEIHQEFPVDPVTGNRLKQTDQ